MEKVSLGKLFLVFTKIGAFTIGGGYVMIPAIEAEVRKQKWIDEDELADMVALSQSAPGLLTVNMSIFVGQKMRGLAGSIVATFGCLLAPFLIILGIAMFFCNVSDNPWVVKMFTGVRPVAVALIAGYFIKMLRRNSKPWQLALAAIALALMVLLKISAIYIILTTIVLATGISLIINRRSSK